MENSASERDPFGRLAEEFALRVRRGERPPRAEYIDKHPELADEIRRAFPAIVMGMRRRQPGRWRPQPATRERSRGSSHEISDNRPIVTLTGRPSARIVC
jgi:hypothetical protein